MAGSYGGYGDLRWRLDYMADTGICLGGGAEYMEDTGICLGGSEYMAERFDASGNFVLVLAAGFALWPVRPETAEQS
mgnify:CR=1 FL=1